MRAVVVGASSGVGRCIGTGLAKRGAQVALLARRRERLVGAAEDAGPGALAIACDVTDEVGCRAAIEEAAAGLGGIDALVYTPGVGFIKQIAELDVDDWRRSFDTNVVGAATVTNAALPYLTESRGAAVYLSSVSASQYPPWPGLAAYVVTKAALDKLIDAYRVEHPQLGFARVAIGDCGGGEGDAGTDFPKDWDWDVARPYVERWLALGYMSGGLLDVEDVVDMVHTVLRSGAAIPSVVVSPRAPSGTGSV